MKSVKLRFYRGHPDNSELLWCPKCETYKHMEEFYNNISQPTGKATRCISCHKEQLKIWLLSKDNKQKYIDAQRRFKVSPKGREATKRYDDKVCREIGNSYLKMLLKNSGIIITDETIELKRIYIVMIRTLKSFKKWRMEDESNHQNVPRKQCADAKDHEGRIQGAGNCSSTAGI